MEYQLQQASERDFRAATSERPGGGSEEPPHGNTNEPEPRRSSEALSLYFAGVGHGWSQITDHVTYLSVRPDPDRVLPAGYVYPLLLKNQPTQAK